MRGRACFVRDRYLQGERVQGPSRVSQIGCCRIRKSESFLPTRRFLRCGCSSRSCRFGLTVALRLSTFGCSAVPPRSHFGSSPPPVGRRESGAETPLLVVGSNSEKQQRELQSKTGTSVEALE